MELQPILDKYFQELQHASPTLKEIQKHIIQKLQMGESSLSLTSIFRLLKKLGYQRKQLKIVPDKRNDKNTRFQRKQKVEDFIDALTDGKNFVFIAEIEFSNIINAIYGYYRKGTRPILRQTQRGPNY